MDKDNPEKPEGIEGQDTRDEKIEPTESDTEPLSEDQGAPILAEVVVPEEERSTEWSSEGAAEGFEEGAEPSPEPSGATVIDLEAFRKRLEQESEPSGFNLQLGKHLREGLRQYLLEYIVPEGQSSGDLDLTFDQDFLKQHVPGIIGTVLQSIAQSIVPKSIDFALPLFSDQKSAIQPENAESLEKTGIEEASGESASPEAPREGEVQALPSPEEAKEGSTGVDISVESQASVAQAELGGHDLADGEVDDATSTPEGKEPDIKISVDVDLVDILKNLLKPKKGD